VAVVGHRSAWGRIASRTFLLATVSATGIAHAQSITPPPVRSNVDENGVDVTTGAFNAATPTISIGQPGNGGLAYGRYYDSISDAWRDNTASGINYDSSSGQYTVTLFGSSSNFILSFGQFSPVEFWGGTLSFNSGTQKYTYTTRDGAVAIFDKALATSQPLQANEGLPTTVTSPNGMVTTFTYTLLSGSGFSARRIQSLQTSFGYQLKFEYQTSNADATGLNLVKVTALNNSEQWCDPTTNSCSGLTGTWPTLTFGTDGANVQTVTDSLSQTTRYTFSSGDLTGIRPPTSGSNTVTVSYSSGKVSAVNVGGSSWGYSYSGSTTTITDPLSHSRVVTFDAGLSAITSDQDALGRTTSYQYDETNRLTRITADEGNYVEFGYDDRGNQLSTLFVPKSGSGLSTISTSASYPTTCTYVATCNKPTSITDERGYVTDFTYNNTHGGVLTVTSPAPSTGAVRPQTRFSYDTVYAWYKTSSGGSLQQGPATTVLVSTSACATTSSCSGGSDEVRTNISFASSNNLLPMSVQSGAGNGTLSATVAFTYNALGDRITTDGPLSGTGDTTKFRYDANRQLIGVIGPDPDGAGTTRKHPATRYTYNSDGQATAVEQGTVNSQSDPDWASFASLAKNEYVYDSIGRVTRSNYIASSTTHAVTQYSYLANNLPECVAIRMNPSEFSSLPSSACTLDTAGSYGNDRITKYIYTNADQVYQVKSAFGTALEQTAATFTYTDNAQQATLADARGNLTTFEYDGFDRMRKIRYPDASNGSTSSTTDYDYFVFDAASNITQWTRRGWASTGLYIDYTYDHLNRQTLANASTGDDISTTYDNLNRPLTQATSAQTLTFAYDALSRMTSVGGPLGTTSYQYDLASNRTRMTWPDSFYVTYDVDLLGMVTAIRENGASSGVGVLAAYEYNDLGQRTSLKRGSSNDLLTTWSYDNARRLSTMTRALSGSGSDQTSGFAWNPAGQQVGQTVTNTSLIGQTPGGSVASYTSNGLNQYASVAATSFTYDARGNLTSDGVKTYGYDIYNRLTSASGGATFGYDPASRLYAPYNGSTTTYLGYDGVDLVGEYSSASSSALTKRYVFGPGVDEPIVWYEGSGTSDRRFLIADERGSIATVANSSGTPLNNNTYTEFGVPGSGNAGRFQYTGQAWMPEAGLYYYKARVYAASIGRFSQPDPIGFSGGTNLYAYVGNDPINFVDPTGTQQICWMEWRERFDGETITAYDRREVCINVEDQSGTNWGPANPWGFGDGGGSGDERVFCSANAAALFLQSQYNAGKLLRDRENNANIIGSKNRWTIGPIKVGPTSNASVRPQRPVLAPGQSFYAWHSHIYSSGFFSVGDAAVNMMFTKEYGDRYLGALLSSPNGLYSTPMTYAGVLTGTRGGSSITESVYSAVPVTSAGC